MFDVFFYKRPFAFTDIYHAFALKLLYGLPHGHAADLVLQRQFILARNPLVRKKPFIDNLILDILFKLDINRDVRIPINDSFT